MIKEKNLSHLKRKSENIINLVNCGFNSRTMDEEFTQHQDLVKTFSEAAREFHAKVEYKDQEAEIWYDEIDQKRFAFENYVYNYIQGNEANLSQQSRKSSKSSR